MLKRKKIPLLRILDKLRAIGIIKADAHLHKHSPITKLAEKQEHIPNNTPDFISK
jgi:hypothetical protein